MPPWVHHFICQHTFSPILTFIIAVNREANMKKD